MISRCLRCCWSASSHPTRSRPLSRGADIVDVKNPAEGSLGAVTSAVLLAVWWARLLELSRAPLSATRPFPAPWPSPPRVPPRAGPAYPKPGSSGARTSRIRGRAPVRGSTRRPTASSAPHVVAVAYADAERTDGFPLAGLPAAAARAGIHADARHRPQGRHLDVRSAGRGRHRLLPRLRAGSRVEDRARGALRLEDGARCARLGVDVVGVRVRCAWEGAGVG